MVVTVIAMPKRPAIKIADQDTRTDDQHRDRRRFHGNGEALDHVGTVTGGRRLGDGTNRPIFRRGVVLGNPDQQAGNDKAQQATEEHIPAVERGRTDRELGAQTDNPLGNRDKEDRRNDRRRQEALVKRGHDVLARAELHEEVAHNRAQNTGTAEDQRKGHHGGLLLTGEKDRSQQHGGNERHGISLKEVRCHTRTVTDIVADVIGDNRGVAGVIFGNSRLDLANQIGTNIRTLGEDAAAQSRED